jgi:hypothetical protein
MPAKTIADRVSLGAALLDAKVPGWWDKVNLKILKIDDLCDCVVAQLFGSYAEGKRQLGLEVLPGKYPSVDHGFCADGQIIEDSLLTGEWVRVIKERRDNVQSGG